MSNSVQTTVWLQIEPRWSFYGNRDQLSDVQGAKVVGMTQNKSSKPKPGTVEIKVTFEIPKGAFLPLTPEAVVTIPEAFTVPHPIEVEAEDPNDGA